MVEDLTKIYRKLLLSFKFERTGDFREDFAARRYLKKMEEPDVRLRDSRKAECFRDYIAFDSRLEMPRLYPGNWYRARARAHKALRTFKLAAVRFTNGSEATPTRGLNSVERKLSGSKWECSPGCFSLWAQTAYETAAIRRMVRRRLATSMSGDVRAVRSFHKTSWSMYGGRKNAKFFCFRRALARVTHVTWVNRFATVPKNREVDRPIALETLPHMLVQRRIGNGIRDLLKRVFGVDLDSLADDHRRLIQKPEMATIDLKNASDSVSVELARFLFPAWFFNLLDEARAPSLLGPDEDAYVLKKVSSMGNGFTFELMSFTLLLLGLEHSSDFSVFGDDILVPNSVASEVISDLEAVGFVVNKEKSFINSAFRESCGAFWHDDHGYIKSFDFLYPKSVHDCVVIHNKARLLGELYPQFAVLAKLLGRSVPRTLQGPVTYSFLNSEMGDEVHGAPSPFEDLDLDGFFQVSKPKGSFRVKDRRIACVLKAYQLDQLERRFFTGFCWNPKLASRTLDVLDASRNTAKYQMYLYGGRRTNDIVTDTGDWQPVTYVQVGQRAFRVKDLLRSYDGPLAHPEA